MISALIPEFSIINCLRRVLFLNKAAASILVNNPACFASLRENDPKLIAFQMSYFFIRFSTEEQANRGKSLLSSNRIQFESTLALLSCEELFLYLLMDPPLNEPPVLKSNFREPSRLQEYRIGGQYFPDSELFHSIISSFNQIEDARNRQLKNFNPIPTILATPGMGKSTLLDVWSQSIWQWQTEKPIIEIRTPDILTKDHRPWLKNALIVTVSFVDSPQYAIHFNHLLIFFIH